ncbi:MAG: ribonuclease III [Bacteroidota bacterium]|nr:ribonuclease III [Bacteroidota bacterium]
MPVFNYFTKDREFKSKLGKMLGFTPGRTSLYRQAFTHKSALPNASEVLVPSNERLEYLGDAVLNLILGEYLYRHLPDKDEGYMSQVRARIVSRECLNRVGRELGLQTWMVEVAPPTVKLNQFPPTLLGNAFEALLGAIFLDKGYKAASGYFSKVMTLCKLEDELLQSADTNFKSRLLEWGQKTGRKIDYRLVSTEKDNSLHVFEMEVTVDGISLGKASAGKKKKAEQEASRVALDNLVDLDFDKPHLSDGSESS